MEINHFLFFLFSSTLWAQSFSGPVDLKEAVYVDDRCHLLDSSFKKLVHINEARFCKLRHGKSELYLFFKDQGVARYKIEKGKIKKQWLYPIEEVHHDLQVSEDGFVAFLSSEFQEVGKKKIRFDSVRILSPEGKLVFQWDFRDHKNDIAKKISLKELIFKGTFKRNYFEITHFNSVSFVNHQFLAVGMGRHSHILLIDRTNPQNTTLIPIPGAGFIHSVRFFKDRFYGFINYTDKEPKKSSLFVYDLRSKSFSPQLSISQEMSFSSTRGNLDFRFDQLLISYKSGELGMIDLEKGKRKFSHHLEFKKYGYNDEDFYQLNFID